MYLQGNSFPKSTQATFRNWGHMFRNKLHKIQSILQSLKLNHLSKTYSNIELACRVHMHMHMYMHSAKEDNLSPFDSKIAHLCQSIKINNKHVYRQCQVRMPIGSEFNWAECSLIIGTGCWIQDFAWSSIAQSVCEWAFSLMAIWCIKLPNFDSCIAQRETTCLLSIRKSFACARASQLTTNIHIHIHAYPIHRVNLSTQNCVLNTFVSHLPLGCKTHFSPCPVICILNPSRWYLIFKQVPWFSSHLHPGRMSAPSRPT